MNEWITYHGKLIYISCITQITLHTYTNKFQFVFVYCVGRGRLYMLSCYNTI